MTRIANLTWKHPKLVLAAVGVFTVLAFALSKDVQQHLKAAGFSDPASESSQAQELLIDKTGSDAMPGIVVRVTPPAGEARLSLRSPALRGSERLSAGLLALEGVARVENPLAGGSPQLIAPDRSSLLLERLLLQQRRRGSRPTPPTKPANSTLETVRGHRRRARQRVQRDQRHPRRTWSGPS